MPRILAGGRRDAKLGTTPSGKTVWLEKRPSDYKGWSESDHLYAAVLHKANRTRGGAVAEEHRALANARESKAFGASHRSHTTMKSTTPDVLQKLKDYKARVRFEDQLRRVSQSQDPDRPRWTAFVQGVFGHDVVGEGATKEAAARAAVAELPPHLRRHFEDNALGTGSRMHSTMADGGSPASVANRLSARDRSTLAWIIEDWPWPFRGSADADMARLRALGLVEPTMEDTWGGATALGRDVWKRARKAWVEENSLGAAFRR